MTTKLGRGRLRWWLAGIVLLLIGYPLSLGPILWMHDNPAVPRRYVYVVWRFSDDAIWIYAPIRLACQYGPPRVTNTVEWYATKWCRRSIFRHVFMQQWCGVGSDF